MCLLLLVLACSHYPDAPSLPGLQIPFSSLAHGVVSGPRALQHSAAVPGKPEAEEELQDLEGCAGTAGNCSRAGLPPCPRARREAFASPGCSGFSSQGFGALCSQASRASSQQRPSSVPAASQRAGSSAHWGRCSSAGVLCCNVFYAGELWF